MRMPTLVPVLVLAPAVLPTCSGASTAVSAALVVSRIEVTNVLGSSGIAVVLTLSSMDVAPGPVDSSSVMEVMAAVVVDSGALVTLPAGASCDLVLCDVPVVVVSSVVCELRVAVTSSSCSLSVVSGILGNSVDTTGAPDNVDRGGTIGEKTGIFDLIPLVDCGWRLGASKLSSG